MTADLGLGSSQTVKKDNKVGEPRYVLLEEGMRVRVKGLQARCELNGLVGTLSTINEDTGRWTVKLGIPGRPNRNLKSANLEPTAMDGKDYVIVDHPSASGKYPIFDKVPGEIVVTVYISRLMELKTEVKVEMGATILDVRRAVAAQDPLGHTNEEDFGIGFPSTDTVQPLNSDMPVTKDMNILDICRALR